MINNIKPINIACDVTNTNQLIGIAVMCIPFLLHLGGGWFVVSSQGSNGSRTNTADYTISASQAVGSYGIAFYCNYYQAAYSSYGSANFYSLHIAN